MFFAWDSERYRRKQAFLRWIEENRPLIEEVLERLRGGEKPASIARDIQARGIPLPPLLSIGSPTRWTSFTVLELRVYVRRAEAGIRLAEYVDEFCLLVERLQMNTSRHEWMEEDLIRVRKAIAGLERWFEQKRVDQWAEDSSERRRLGEKVIPFHAVLKNRDLLLSRIRRPAH